MSHKNKDVESGSSSTPSMEEDDGYIFDKQTRKDFVAKVYTILTLQLVITFVIVFAMNLNKDVREFMHDYFWIVWIFMVVQITVYCVIACSEEVRRSYPLNFVLLTFHTLVFALVAAWISARYEIKVIWLAFIATAAITLVVTVFAKFSPWDVTGCETFIFIAFLAAIVFSVMILLVSVFIRIRILEGVLAGIFVVLLSFYLMFMTQKILGGFSEELRPDEVVYAVIELYTAIVKIFLNMLRLCRCCDC